ncbi:MAG: bifunctional glycoside hydrolase 114/ polysaccharide deacetylase family protein [Nitrospirae bacterium]|nr:bifunctional glycoside hydrolase 114/ polysaccharide deacetylase family protein [Nitrospirota bacterium]
MNRAARGQERADWVARMWDCLLAGGLLSLALSVSASLASDPAVQPTVAFYYGAELPVDELRAFDVVVVEPDHGFDPTTYRTSTSELFAYVSLGEVEPKRPYGKDMPQAWFNGTNTAWGAHVVDQTQPEWPAFVVERIVAPLWARGYRGLFLDTLDSYQLAVEKPEARRLQEQGLAAVIRAIKKTYPELRLIFNRGFEILPDVHREAFAVAVESLYQEWDQAQKQYGEVSQSERDWILGQLKTVTSQYHLPVIVIDYVPPAQRDLARRTAKKVKDLGYIPWVSTPALDYLGIGSIEVMPRKVLVLYDGRVDPDLRKAPVHRFLDFPLNYLGYVPDHWDVQNGLPSFPLVGRYAGLVTWFRSDTTAVSGVLPQWLQLHVEQGLHLAILDHFGFGPDNVRLKPFALLLSAVHGDLVPVTVQFKDSRVGYEVAPLPDPEAFLPIRALKGHALLTIQRRAGEFQDAVAAMPWGGYALSPYVVRELLTPDQFRWVIDPLRFLQEALALPPMPVPDTTTENGRRLLLIHIDGDGFPSKAEFPGAPFSGEVVLKEILEKYKVPTTVSVIEGEVAATGKYPQLAPQLERIARRIFSLPFVEIASHSYSHPFFWMTQNQDPNKPESVSLAIPGYRYSAETFDREIAGSLDYINRTLAPAGKRAEVFLWSGDTNPPEDAIAKAYAARVYNFNGGKTLMTRTNPSLTAVAPLGLKKGEFFQVFAPNQNENEYTNLWTGPFYGFERVIETFELTEKPRRLKPINIYYHFYSGTKKASLRALQKVYDWALAQLVSPVSVSDYAKKVVDFQHLVIARDEQS